MIVTYSGRKGQGKFMRELQKEEYVLTKDDVQDLIKGVSGILNRVDERYDLSVKELRILQEKSDIYDSFRYGFYKGMMYQKSKQQNVVEEKTDVAPVQSAVIDFDQLYEDTLDYAPEASERLREALNSMNKAFEVYLDEVQKGAFRQGYTVAAEHKR